MPAPGLSLIAEPHFVKDETSIELSSPEEQRRLARGFKWYAQALETTVQDGLFLLKRPDAVFLLDFDILRAYLRPVGIPSDVVGLISVFLRHENVRYAIPPGCFEELLEWLTPLRQQLLELKTAWSDDARRSAEARLGQFLRLAARDLADKGDSLDGNALDELLTIAERLERLFSTERFVGFADSYDKTLAAALEKQLSRARDRVEPNRPHHNKRDSRDAANISSAKSGSLYGASWPLVLLTRTKEVATLLDDDDGTLNVIFDSFFSVRSNDPSELEFYPILGIQRLAGLWSVGFFNNPAGTVNEAQVFAGLCRGVNQKLMDQAVFRELAGSRGSKTEELLAKREQPAIMNTFDDVVRHVLSVQFELARIAESEQTKLEVPAPEEASTKAERILVLMSSVAKKLFGRGTLNFEAKGVCNDFVTISVSRVLGARQRPLLMFRLTKFEPTSELPEQTIVRWPTACNPYRLLEALGQVIKLKPADLKWFDPQFMDEDMLHKIPDGVLIHTNAGAFLISYLAFVDSARGRLRFPGRGRLIRMLETERLKRAGTSSQGVEEIQQLVLPTPAGDVYLDLEKVGVNEDRYFAVASDGPFKIEHIAYLIDQTGVWWMEADEANSALADSVHKAREFFAR
jgi:hypothetical protein